MIFIANAYGFLGSADPAKLEVLDKIFGTQPGISTFFQEFWQARPLVARRNNPTFFENLFSIANVDDVIIHGVNVQDNTASSMEYGRDWKVVKRTKEDGEWWSGSLAREDFNLSDVEMAHVAFGKGFSLVINNMEQRWRPIQALAHIMEELIGYRVGVNLYLSPPNAQGFEVHMDWMDTIVVQVEGEKNWKLYDALLELPRPDMKFKPKLEDVGEPFIEFKLKAGELLYMPAGLIHEASTLGLDKPSLHLTFGIESTVLGSYESFLLEAIDWLSRYNHEIPFKCMRSKRDLSTLLSGVFPKKGEKKASLLWGDVLRMIVIDVATKEISLRKALPRTSLVRENSQETPKHAVQAIFGAMRKYGDPLVSLKMVKGFTNETRVSHSIEGGSNFALSPEILTAVKNLDLTSLDEETLLKKYHKMLSELLCVFEDEGSLNRFLMHFSEVVQTDLISHRSYHIENLAKFEKSFLAAIEKAEAVQKQQDRRAFIEQTGAMII